MALAKQDPACLGAIGFFQTSQNLARAVRLPDSYSVCLTEKSYPHLEHPALGKGIHSYSEKSRLKPVREDGATRGTLSEDQYSPVL